MATVNKLTAIYTQLLQARVTPSLPPVTVYSFTSFITKTFIRFFSHSRHIHIPS